MTAKEQRLYDLVEDMRADGALSDEFAQCHHDKQRAWIDAYERYRGLVAMYAGVVRAGGTLDAADQQFLEDALAAAAKAGHEFDFIKRGLGEVIDVALQASRENEEKKQ